ncbi:MAG: carbamoyltransferase HypF [Firmicutes bacterium]|nr:carbamoyltransferase HypF [Bacillota bacterium]
MTGAAVRIRVFGIVQAVGFRPTVSRHAMKYDIAGSVCNMGPYVEIFAQGTEQNVQDFVRAVWEEPPARAVILKMDVEPAVQDPEIRTFTIAESGKVSGEIFVSPDIAICEDCKKELYDPENRRYLHPFINCTCCGPRLTIMDGMPYDRHRTSMKSFPMCPDCAEEYEDPATRRYDAQPVCCNDCGPELYLLDRPERGMEALRAVRRALAQGKIAAVKGIGGFHLCADATNEEAVQLLRQRKKRPVKPFAVMMKDMAAVSRECYCSAREEAVLTGHQKPILLLPKKADGYLAPSVAPGNPKAGVMLPYAPVQLLLFDCGDADDTEMPDCLVMTSANASGAPICRDDRDAREELGGLCDLIMSHDRPILIRSDDTVMDSFRGEPYMIRRSRGYAPLPFMLSGGRKGTVLAIGGELKNTFCVGKNDLLYPSSYVGDMADLRTVKALEESTGRMLELLEAEPELIVCDMHPGYNTTEFAFETGRRLQIPVVQVQHHYAHILSCMAENDVQEPVIGVSFDGTGYGTDGTIWGGEILLADPEDFQRWGSLRPFRQIGGDLSAMEGWRIAASMLLDRSRKEEAASLSAQLALCTEKEFQVLSVMKERGINSVLSTSAGRLFDGASALLGIRRSSSFEGEASMALQFAAMKAGGWSGSAGSLPDPKGEKDADGLYRLPSERLIEYLLAGRKKNLRTEELAAGFHEGLAEMIAEACRQASRETGRRKVCLSGGVFQNTLLLELCCDRLEKEGFTVLRHHSLAPNDGGLCLGQAMYGMYLLNR